MKTVTIGTIKGGDGKSSLCILLSRHLASIGHRVLTLDLDVQNSTSYSLLPDGDPAGRHIVRAIIEDDVAGQTIPLSATHSLVQCDYKLTQLRTMSPNTIKACLCKVSDQYDYCLIDTPPYYDNIVISGMSAADLILLPVMLKNSFSIKASRFVREALTVDAPALAEHLFVLYNFFEDDGVGREYMQHFQAVHGDAFFTVRFPKTAQVRRAVDYHQLPTDTAKFDVLFPALQALAVEITHWFEQ
jgi:cellulose biosynthesis protein BcsQ